MLLCGIAFAATVILLRMSDRAVPPAVPTTEQLPAPVATNNTAKASASAKSRLEEIVGRATVIDGDAIEVQRQRIRFHGIDAPESGQTCFGEDSKPYLCGSKAAFALSDFLGDATVRCEALSRDQYRRVVARCFARGEDLALLLVRSGWALDWPRYSRSEYSPAQLEAQAAKRGIWAGRFVEPWNYRACMRSGAQRTCSIPN